MNEINRLWDKWVKDHEDEDVDQIIAYFRKQLAMYDQGVKPKKVEAEQVDVDKIIQKIKQRSWTGASNVSNAAGQSVATHPAHKGKGLRRI